MSDIKTITEKIKAVISDSTMESKFVNARVIDASIVCHSELALIGDKLMLFNSLGERFFPNRDELELISETI